MPFYHYYFNNNVTKKIGFCTMWTIFLWIEVVFFSWHLRHPKIMLPDLTWKVSPQLLRRLILLFSCWQSSTRWNCTAFLWHRITAFIFIWRNAHKCSCQKEWLIWDNQRRVGGISWVVVCLCWYVLLCYSPCQTLMCQYFSKEYMKHTDCIFTLVLI